jgi:hypothetical protein
MSRLPYYEEYLSEGCGASPVPQNCKAKRFISRSKGWRNGKRRIRKQEKDIILLQYGKGWKYWDGGDHNHNGNIPFDQWATEIYGLPFCEALPCHPDDYLRQDIKQHLAIGGGKF